MGELVEWLRAQIQASERLVPGLGFDSEEPLRPGSAAAFQVLRDDRAVVDTYDRVRREAPTSRRAFWLERVVRDMALERADRPGFKESWRP